MHYFANFYFHHLRKEWNILHNLLSSLLFFVSGQGSHPSMLCLKVLELRIFSAKEMGKKISVINLFSLAMERSILSLHWQFCTNPTSFIELVSVKINAPEDDRMMYLVLDFLHVQ